ncbi:hypothetical protein AVEN_210910-1 [Araneus ventricosus]|uniref:Uncharacterized protein n=1 Tax=Araneus ventricosus TaxID=182803 RepID=A0A4Y2N668_ARAVE|nr:hypothetical protein AVEN_210910-1 [Araneus ventricosus]
MDPRPKQIQDAIRITRRPSNCNFIPGRCTMSRKIIPITESAEGLGEVRDERAGVSSASEQPSKNDDARGAGKHPNICNIATDVTWYSRSAIYNIKYFPQYLIIYERKSDYK